ncbi:DUF2282 domain-containing protein [Minwuia thermotolerans]|uniref:DUF2282 domain-containing protein n=1 Tax=Minwuia thermotolerans TaxID=2056226 RepID=A0A2M9FZQ6_9PROT|nr:DUF2282 domain-containing protein [Minwuia thermotolerans]PJK28957.1 hypothetical protein CVT23_13615 [Minwuia thermotolerans]
MNATFKSLSVVAALAGAVGMAATLGPVEAVAADKVKCYGIAKAGQNDCANKAGTHSCAGQSTVDYSGGEWKLATKAECEEKGGQEQAFDGVNEKMKG